MARLNYKYDLAYRQKIAFDNSSVFSTSEAAYFQSIKSNIHFKNQLSDSIDFAGKKIASLDKDDIISKQEFFNRYGDKEVTLLFERVQDNEIQQNDEYYGIMSMRKKKKIMQQLL